MADPIRKLARFVYLGRDKDDGLMLGVSFKEGRSFFKRGMVYEMTEVLGEVQVKEVGPSFLEPKPGKPGYGWRIDSVLDVYGKHLVLTKKEFNFRNAKNSFGFIIRVNAGFDQYITIKAKDILSSCTQMMSRIKRHVDQGDQVGIDYEVAHNGTCISILELDHPIKTFYETGKVCPNKTRTTR